jgi:colanic acid/amylovoran biosynthesis glycosyltransferase
LLRRTHLLTVPRSLPKRGWNALGLVARMIKNRQLKILKALNIRAYGRQAASLRLLYRLYPLLKRGPYDILHCHFGPVGLTGLHLKELGVPGKFIVTFHGHDLSRFLQMRGRGVYRRLFEKADLLLPISDYWKEHLIQLGADPDRVRVHRMGIDLDRFPFHPRSAHPSGETRLMTVGRLVEKKGIAYGLQALAGVLRRHPDWKVRYNIIGSGKQEPNLRELIAQLGLEDCVHLVGAKTGDEVHQTMLDSDIFMLPSVTDDNGDQEGVPVSLMEAMASGLPVLSTLHTGIPELVQDGTSGFLAPEKDVEALSDRLEFLISHPEAWEAMGRSGRRRVETNHNIKRLNLELAAIYQALMSQSPESSESTRRVLVDS